MAFSHDRITRVNEILKREIADLIESEGLNDGGALVSVTKVNASSSLREAAVYISIFGAADEARKKAIVKELERHRPELQRRIARDVVLKYTPVLHFVIDKNIEEGDRVLAIIRELEEDGE